MTCAAIWSTTTRSV